MTLAEQSEQTLHQLLNRFAQACAFGDDLSRVNAAEAIKAYVAALASQQAVKGEPVAMILRGEGGAFKFNGFVSENRKAIYELEFGEHPLYLRPSASPPSREPLTPDSWEEIDAVIACLGDDAAQLRGENPEDERAANMERAAELLAFAYGIHSREGGSK